MNTKKRNKIYSAIRLLAKTSKILAECSQPEATEKDYILTEEMGSLKDRQCECEYLIIELSGLAQEVEND